MAKSVRIDRQLESCRQQIAKVSGLTKSKVIQNAMAKRCDQMPKPSLADSLAPFIGRVKSAGGRARHTGTAFRQALGKKKTS
ncbi:MAG: hypothetical protein A3F90_01945 [Deltaproteobacteria bacterium RIFCSPLOWO2_12_FULL_60_19]|nr:MAG: hypothetical protein A3F90_01945 [Deltaproteobacteria bacterium RIFCSPLOWO2_12_FULL_60_19]